MISCNESDRETGDRISIGDIQGVGIAIGTDASVEIYGDVHYYPTKLRAPLRAVFDPLLADRTTLFGGREWALHQVAESIQDPEGGYLVITAPAGFGKTAIIANLVSRAPEAFAYHFFTPIYVTEGLSEDFFLCNVIQQIAQWHHQKGLLPATLHELSALYHQFLDEPLERIQVLVLDGLDEVTTWKLSRYLCRRLPPNLHIILTIRDVGQDWAAEYGLPSKQIKHLPLGGLTRDEVAQVLRAAGGSAVEFADDAVLLDEVMRVSAYQTDETLGADPFYIRLLAEDIAEGHLTAVNITGQPQGLDAYLDRWWQEIKRLAGDQPGQDLFGTLTMAMGPISRNVLEALNPSLTDEWARDHFRDVLSRARRWILGDAKRGYALGHPRLHQYLQTRISTNVYRDKLLSFCAKWQEHTSPYALIYYAQHLTEAGSIDELYALVESPDWTSAKYIATPWIDSLIQDLQLASAAAVDAGVEGWSRSMAYQLRRTLIEDLMSRLSSNVTIFMARLGRVDQALHFAKRHMWESFQLYHKIAQTVAESNPGKALDIFLQSIRLFDHSSILNQYGARLVVARALLENQKILTEVPAAAQKALELVAQAEKMQTHIQQADVYSWQARYSCPILVQSGRPEEARELAETLPLAQQSQALCHIALALRSGHPEKIPLAKRALKILEGAEQNAENMTSEVQAIVTLMPYASSKRRTQCIQRLISLEDVLRSVSDTLPRPSWSWAVEIIAEHDLERAKEIVFESEWNSGWKSAWPALLRKIALHDPEEAIQIADNQYSKYAGYPSILVEIIKIIAVQFGDIDKAGEMIRQHSERLSGSLGQISEAYLALAEAHFAQGNKRKAEEIFDEQVFVINDQGVRRGRDDLLVAMVGRSSIVDSCDVETAFEHLENVGEGRSFSARRLLGILAARQGKIDFIEMHRLGPEAELTAVCEIATHDPELARAHWQEWSPSWPAKMRNERSHADALIRAREASKDPDKLDDFLQCFAGNGGPHHMCSKMVALPNALCLLLEENRIHPDRAKAVIEQTYPVLMGWECRQQKVDCECHSRSERALVLLLVAMAQVDRKRAESMTESLPPGPVKASALKSILRHTEPSASLLERVIESSREAFGDPLTLAGSYYDLAANVLPPGERDWITRLLQLAEPLVDDKAWASPPTKLKKNRAKARIKLVDSPDQFNCVEEAVNRVGSFSDKVELLDVLTEQSMKWSWEQRQALLRQIWELAARQRRVNVEAFIASSVPILESLMIDPEDSFWAFLDAVGWAYQELPRSNPEMKTGICNHEEGI